MEMDYAHLLCGDTYLVIWLHSDIDPISERWTECIREMESLKRNVSGDLSKIKALVVTDGGAPDAVQRRALMTETFGGQVKSAAITTVLSNPIKRGIATAILWLNPDFRAFAPNQFDLALKHLNLEAYSANVLTVLKTLQLKMPPNETLRIILSTKEA
jgi:hypothetical protein